MKIHTLKYFYYYIKEILESQGKLSFSNIDESVSHDGLTRTMSKEHQLQTLYWSFIEYFIKTFGGYLIIDDTILEKPYSQTGTFVRHVYSNKEGKTVKGIQVVLLLLVVNKERIPIDFRIYDKSKTKIELALELLSYARNTLKLKKMIVLFDSWYACKKILKRISDYGWYFVCRIKKNRKISNTKLKHLFVSPYGMMEVQLNGIKCKLVRHGNFYIITNKLSLSKEDIRSMYRNRAIIEEVFRILKNQFKVKDCQSRCIQAWKNHISLCCLCFCFVEFEIQKNNITIYKARKHHSFQVYMPYLNLWNSILECA